MGENVVFLVIFDSCDVMYNYSISLLPSILLDNLFGYSNNSGLKLKYIFSLDIYCLKWASFSPQSVPAPAYLLYSPILNYTLRNNPNLRLQVKPDFYALSE